MHDSEHSQRANRLSSLAAAVIAVLAALGSLFSHHQSIAALNDKNQAILVQARALNDWNKSESSSIKYHVYQALIVAGVAHPNDAIAKRLAGELAKSSRLEGQASTLEAQAANSESLSEIKLKSYETLEVGTTFFEIAIVLVSISTLAQNRLFLGLGSGLSAVGIAFLIAGLLQGH